MSRASHLTNPCAGLVLGTSLKEAIAIARHALLRADTLSSADPAAEAKCIPHLALDDETRGVDMLSGLKEVADELPDRAIARANVALLVTSAPVGSWDVLGSYHRTALPAFGRPAVGMLLGVVSKPGCRSALRQPIGVGPSHYVADRVHSGASVRAPSRAGSLAQLLRGGQSRAADPSMP